MFFLLPLDALPPFPGAGQFGGGFVDAEAVVFALVFQHGGFALAAGVGFGDGADVGVGLFDLQHKRLAFFPQGGAPRFEIVQLAAQAVIVGLGGFILALLVPQQFVGAADGVHPEGDFQAFAGGGQFQELLGLLAVALQGADALFQFAQNIPQAFQVALGGGQAVFGLVLAVAVFGDAGGFLKNFPPLGGFGAHDLGDTALAHDGVAVAPQAGVQQQFVHILEADVLAVDGILADAAAVVPAADGNFLGVHFQPVVAVVDGQRDGCVAHGPAGLGAAEDDVLHLAGTAELLGAGLAQHPADGVRDVGLAGAVGPHDAGDPGADGDAGAVREGLEPLDFQFFQAHAVSLQCKIFNSRRR